MAALELPAGTRVGRRVPKTLLVEHGAPTATGRRDINEGVEEVHWLATLKPTTVGVSTHRDELREYLEIAILSVVLRADAQAQRLATLLHRAVPYPMFLLVTKGPILTLSLAHKRWSHNQAGATVLDGEPVAVALPTDAPDGPLLAFRDALSLSRQPRDDLFLLYQGWMDTALALLAAQITGTFAMPASADHAALRRKALGECAELETEIMRLRAAATKERQIQKRVAINLGLKRAEAARAAAQARL
jgi:hypothetical protein